MSKLKNNKVKVFINGSWQGITETPIELYNDLKEKKFKGIIMKNNITVILYIISAILVIGGSLIFFAPKYLIRLGESLNREYGTKSKSKPTSFPR